MWASAKPLSGTRLTISPLLWQGVVKVGAVDADQHQSLAGQFGVRGFPTIKVFGANKRKPEDYNGDRSARGLVDGGIRAAKDMVNARMGGRVSDSNELMVVSVYFRCFRMLLVLRKCLCMENLEGFHYDVL